MAQALAGTTTLHEALQDEATRARAALASMTAEHAALQRQIDAQHRELAHDHAINFIVIVPRYAFLRHHNSFY